MVVASLFLESGLARPVALEHCWVTRYSCYRCATSRYARGPGQAQEGKGGGWQGGGSRGHRKGGGNGGGNRLLVGPIGTIQTLVPGGDPSYRKQGTAAGGSGVRRARVEDLGPGVQVNLEKEFREQGQEADRRLRFEIRYRLFGSFLESG